MSANLKPDTIRYIPRVYIPISCIVLVVLIVLLISLKTASKMIHTYVPLVETVKEIRLETTTGHLWFEEILSGDREEDIESVRQHLDNGIRYTRSILEGGKSPLNTNMPALRDTDLRNLLTRCLALQKDYRRIMESRYSRFGRGGAGPGSAIDQQFDQVFNGFLQQAIKAEAGLHDLIDKQWRNFRFMGAGLALLAVLSGLSAGLIIRRYLREKDQAILALTESEENIRITLDSIGDAVIVADARGRIVRMNPVGEALTGWRLAKAKGRPLSEIFRIVNAITRERAADPVEKVIKTGLVVGLANHTVLVARDGTEYQIADSGAPIRDRQGKIIGVVVVFRDVTQEYDRERVIAENEERFRSLFNNMGSGAAVYKAANKGRDFVFLDFNRAAERIEGISREEVLDRNVLDVFPGVKDLGLLDAMERVWRTGEPEFLPAAIYRDERLMSWRENYIYRLSMGEVVTIYDDVTERMAMEEELLQSKQFLEKALDSLTHPFYVIDARDYSVKLANRAARQGKSIEGVTCYQLSQQQHEPCRCRDHTCPLDQVRQSGRSVVVEHVYSSDEERDTYVEIHAHPIFDGEGRVVQVIEYCLDVTERRKGEGERLRLVTAIEQVEDSIVISDKEGSILYVNPAFEIITGYNKEEVLGEKSGIVKSGVHEEEFYREMWKTLMEGESWHGRLTNKKKNGELYEEEVTITPVFAEDGKIENYVAVKRDITERVKLERQLRQTQKMEAIGTLAGGIAHDFNNILAAILGFSELAREKVAWNDEVRGDLDKVLGAARRARELVRQILTFSRETEKNLQPLKVQHILKEALKMLRSTIPVTITIKENIDPGCGPVLADATQIYQVIMNLSTNAYQAMSEKGGILGVSLTEAALTADDLPGKSPLEPGKYVILEVSDTGPGIPKDLVERIFEPYFTTKKQEEGTGLGLSMVHGIVSSHGGHVSVYSGPEQGATFRIYLPLHSQDANSLERLEAVVHLPTGNEKILAVDDEEDVAYIYKKMLESLGYSVDALTSSTEALEVFEQEPEGYDLIITDMTMPGLTGSQLSTRILSRKPDIPIIVCTGYSELINREKAQEIGVKEFLMKPVGKKTLATTVRRLLDVR